MRYKDETGNVVIEASIVMTIAVVMIAVLINLGIMLYNRNLMETVATNVAFDVANVYSSTYRDPMYGYMDDGEFYKTELYRNLANVFTSSHDETAERKATWYALYSLKKHEMSEIQDVDIDVRIDTKPGTMIRRQVVVTIKARFEAPFTAVWGGNNEVTYTVEGRADCIDLLDYFNTVGTVKDTVLSKLDKLLENINKVIGIFDLSSLEG